MLWELRLGMETKFEEGRERRPNPNNSRICGLTFIFSSVQLWPPSSPSLPPSSLPPNFTILFLGLAAANVKGTITIVGEASKGEMYLRDKLKLLYN